MAKNGIENDLEFQDCLKRGKIKEFSRGKSLVSKELIAAKSDLNIAKSTLKVKGYKWATIQSYYSMFHSARALLYSKDFREKSHYCLIRALKALFASTGQVPLKLVEKMQKAKMLREAADY